MVEESEWISLLQSDHILPLLVSTLEDHIEHRNGMIGMIMNGIDMTVETDTETIIDVIVIEEALHHMLVAVRRRPTVDVDRHHLTIEIATGIDLQDTVVVIERKNKGKKETDEKI